MGAKILVKEKTQILENHRYEWICIVCEIENVVISRKKVSYLYCKGCNTEVVYDEILGVWG